MSHEATNWAIKQRGLRPIAKIVLWHLADCHNPTMGCFPTQEHLARQAEISRASVNRVLTELEAAGLIRREQRVDETTGRQRPTRYHLACEEGFTPLDVVARVSPVDTDEEAEPCLISDESRVSKSGVSVSHSSETQTSKLTGKETGNPAQSAEGVRDFEESLWVDFPRATNSRKQPALKAFLRLKPHERRACISGAARYALRFEDDKTDKRPVEVRLQYVPHLSTWINQRGWEQELELA